ncbi:MULTISPECIES: phycobilisome rod-core linker polypeptide [Moorena]|nr:phycobilisome rod-core linker polypeptide [Moorena producens]
MDSSKLPLTGKAIADMAAQKWQVATNPSELAKVGRSSNRKHSTLNPKSAKATRIFRITPNISQVETAVVIDAIYDQVLDLFGEPVPPKYRQQHLDSQLRNGEISVRQFVKALASSNSYSQRFYQPYPPAKVVELLFRHLLGRNPNTHGEVQTYQQLLAGQGLEAAVTAMVDSREYSRFFGEDVVPYQRLSQ